MIEPAEASTELGADQDGGSPGEGGAIAVLWAVGIVLLCVVVASWLARLA